MTKLWKNLWGRLLFRDSGIVPTKRFLLLFLLLSVIISLFAWWGFTWWQVILMDGLVLAVSLLDVFQTPKRKQLTFSRTIPNQLERGIPYTVSINVENHAEKPCLIKLIDGKPQSFLADFPLQGHVHGQESVTLTYEVMAPVRGKYSLDKLFIRYQSVFGLWEKQMAAPVLDEVRVIPDLTETKKYLEDAQHYLIHEGMKIRKRKSGVGEFSQIRNYVVGDDPRKINWRQTAKLQTVMTNEYEPEHGKHVMLVLDTGRTMGAELKEVNRLEKAIEATLTVAAAALGNGDYVGVIAFSKNVSVFVPPDKGMGQLQKIIDAVYNLKVDAAESNYVLAFQYLQAVLKKRGLVLLFSDIHTLLQEESIIANFEGIRKRNLFLFLSITDELLIRRANQDPSDQNHAMVKGIAQQQILSMKRQKAKWEKQGLVVVEAKEDRLASTAVSQYIHIMNQGLV